MCGIAGFNWKDQSLVEAMGGTMRHSGPIRYEYVNRLYGEHIDGVRDNARELWLIFVYNCWRHKNRC